jgi:hypothetical protein
MMRTIALGSILLAIASATAQAKVKQDDQLCQLLENAIGVQQALVALKSNAKVEVIDFVRISRRASNFWSEILKLKDSQNHSIEFFSEIAMLASHAVGPDLNLKLFVSYQLLSNADDQQLNVIKESLKALFPKETAFQDERSLQITQAGIILAGRDLLEASLSQFYLEALRFKATDDVLSASEINDARSASGKAMSNCKNLDSSILDFSVNVLDSATEDEIEAAEVSWYEGRGTIAIQDAHNSPSRDKIFYQRLIKVANGLARKHIQQEHESAYLDAVQKARFSFLFDSDRKPKFVLDN